MVVEEEVGLGPGPGRARRREAKPDQGRAARDPDPGVGMGGEIVREAEVPAEVAVGDPGATAGPAGLAIEEGPGAPGGGLGLTGEGRDQGRSQRSWRGRDCTLPTWTVEPVSGTWRKYSRDSAPSSRSGWPRVFPASPSWCSRGRRTLTRPADLLTARISVGGESG